MNARLLFAKTAGVLLSAALAVTACAPAATPAPATSAPGATEAPSTEPVTITMLVDDRPESIAQTESVIKAFQAKYPHITVQLETRGQGSDGDNIVKTRLATGEMTDVFAYNSGSLFQALNPTETLVDLSDEPFVANTAEAFFPTVSVGGQIFGAPYGTATGGGILYNKKVYEQLGLSVPTTWAEFAANNEAIKAAGITPVIATYGDTWTSQLFVLADYYNVEVAVPTFADDYTNNKAKYATIPAAMKGFAYLQEGFEKGWYQADFATDKLDTGVKMLAEGTGAHYPMLTFVMGALAAQYPDNVNDIGFFGVPGDDAAKAGATIWVAGGVYIPTTTQHLAEAKLFVNFIASAEGSAAITEAVPPTGPYMIKGVKLPDDALPAVKDVAAYIDSGLSGPALEFLSPIKGPALEQICVAVGSGQMSAEDGAKAYDDDVVKQAQQLGLPGWDK